MSSWNSTLTYLPIPSVVISCISVSFTTSTVSDKEARIRRLVAKFGDLVAKYGLRRGLVVRVLGMARVLCSVGEVWRLVRSLEISLRSSTAR